MPRKNRKTKKATKTRYNDRPFSKLEQELRSNFQSNRKRGIP